MKNLFYLTFILLSLASCSEYNRVLKGDDYGKKYELANELYGRKKWSQSVALYEQVYQRLPKTGEGESSYFRIGKAYFNDEDYYMSGYFFGSFFDKYPYSTKVEEAFFIKVICSVKNSPAYNFDQQETDFALNEVQQFIYLFPNSSKIDTCNIIMDNLRLKLERKEYENIKLYSKTLNFKSAIVYSETFLNTYPTSKYKEEIHYIMIKNSFSLAKNSVSSKKVARIEDTIETYRIFVAQYPESKHKKELDILHKEMQKELVTVNNSKSNK